MRDAAGESGGVDWGSPEWAARREVEVLKLLCDGNVAKMQRLWLRKQQVMSGTRQQAGGQARPKQQSRADRPGLEPAAQPKQQTQAQAARRERSRKRLSQKHLAAKLWACVRIAIRLQAWRFRATSVGAQPRCRERGDQPPTAASALFGADGRFYSICGGYRRVLQHRLARKLLPASFPAARPATVAAAVPATVLEAVAAPLMRSAATPAFGRLQPAAPVLPAPPPAGLLAAPAPPGQQQLDPGQLAAAARANLDESELQDNRGSKRVASARTPPPKSNPSHPNPANQPPPPPPGPKKSRGGAACSAALAAAAPSPAAAAAAPQQLITATTYAAAALAAANPRHTSA